MGAVNGASTGTLRRKTGQKTTDTRGLQVPEWVTISTDLPSRVAGTAANSAPYRTVSTPGGDVEVAARVIHFPAATADLRDGDYYEVTAGALSGLAFEIVEATWQDQATARRVPAVEVQRPEEWS